MSIVVGLTIGFEMASYSVAEEAGSLAVKVVARTGSGAATPDASAFVSFSTTELDPLEARITQDYEPVSQIVIFAPSDFSVDGSVFKAEQTVSITIVDNAIDEQAERFGVLLDMAPGLPRRYHNFVDTNGAACQDTLCPTLVTIIDTDPVSADITGIEITSTPASGSFYETGEAITVAVTYDQTVAVNTTSGTPTLDLEIEVAQAASYTSISSDNLALTFSLHRSRGRPGPERHSDSGRVHRSQRGRDHRAGDERRGAPGLSEAWQGRHPEGQQGPGDHKRRRDDHL